MSARAARVDEALVDAPVDREVVARGVPGWGVALSVVVLVVALATAPYLVAACCAPAGSAGLGTFWFVNDFAQYEAALFQGYRGGPWHLADHFTTESHRPTLMYPLYVGLGRAAALLGVEPMEAYRAAEALSRAALVAALVVFVARFTRRRTERCYAVALGLVGGGLGLWYAVLRQVAPFPPYEPTWAYETYTFGTLLGAPHVMLGVALTLLALLLYWQAGGGSTAGMVGLLLAVVGLGLIHPFNLPTLLAIWWLHAALSWWSGEGRRRVVVAALAAVASLPALLQHVATFLADPFWSSVYGAQNRLPSPAIDALPIEYGLLLPLAIASVPGLWRRGTEGRYLVLCTAVILVAIYLPVPFQRRLGLGLHPLLALAAGVALAQAADSLPRGARRLALVTVFVLACSSTGLVLTAAVASALTGSPLPIYRVTDGEARAARWLAARTAENAVVLASWDTGNYLAGRLAGRVVGGHPVATLHPEEKRARIEAFFTGEALERADIVCDLGVTHLFVGRRERLLAGDHVDESPWMKRIYGEGDVAIYEVRCER